MPRTGRQVIAAASSGVAPSMCLWELGASASRLGAHPRTFSSERSQIPFSMQHLLSEQPAPAEPSSRLRYKILTWLMDKLSQLMSLIVALAVVLWFPLFLYPDLIPALSNKVFKGNHNQSL